jgi:hypothetical protein
MENKKIIVISCCHEKNSHRWFKAAVTFNILLHYVNKHWALTSGVIMYLTQKVCINTKARRKRAKEGGKVRRETQNSK